MTISSTTVGASIRYTTDGSTPTSTTGTVYTTPVSVAATQTLKAIAYLSGYTDSSVSSAAYVINPVVSGVVSYPGMTRAFTVTSGSGTLQTTGAIPLDATYGTFNATEGQVRYYSGTIAMDYAHPAWSMNNTVTVNFIWNIMNHASGPATIGVGVPDGAIKFNFPGAAFSNMGALPGSLNYQVKLTGTAFGGYQIQVFTGAAATAATEGTPTATGGGNFTWEGDAFTAVSFSTSGDQANGIASSSNFKSSDAWISGASAAPSGLAATANSASQISLNWTDNSADETGFKVERSPDGSTAWTQIATPAANVTSYADTGRSAVTTYFYRVRATSAAGDSAYTSTVSATTSKLDQTITFAAIAGKTFGDAPFALDATASSGLPVSYASSNNAVATVAGNTVTVVGVGTATITASQSGDVSNNAATDAAQTLTVGKAAQSITFGAIAAKTYGDASFALAATASSGLPVSYASSNNAVATVAGNTVTVVGAGTATITASQAGDASYNAATDATQTLTVGKAAQSITFGAIAAKTYGDASFALAATASSGLPVSYASSNNAVATVAGNTVTVVGAGTAIITASQSGDASYSAATDAAQTLTVGKAAQSITFGAIAAKTYGDAPFALDATASSGLTVSYESSDNAVAMVSGNTVTLVAAGSVTITASQSGNANYAPAANVLFRRSSSSPRPPSHPSFHLRAARSRAPRASRFPPPPSAQASAPPRMAARPPAPPARLQRSDFREHVANAQGHRLPVRLYGQQREQRGLCHQSGGIRRCLLSGHDPGLHRHERQRRSPNHRRDPARPHLWFTSTPHRARCVTTRAPLPWITLTRRGR